MLLNAYLTMHRAAPVPLTKNYQPQLSTILSSEPLQVASVPLAEGPPPHLSFPKWFSPSLTPSFLFPILGDWLQTRRVLQKLCFPDGSAGEAYACNAGDTGNAGSTPGSGRSPGVGNGNRLQYSYLGNPMNRRA